MNRSFIGKFRHTAAEQFAKKIHNDRLHGKLDITRQEEKQIDERFVKVFGKKTRVKEREIEKEVLNPLRIKTNDKFSREEVDAVDRGFGFVSHTKQVGNKYSQILRQEKKAEFQKRHEAVKIEKDKVQTVAPAAPAKPSSYYLMLKDKIAKAAEIKEQMRKEAEQDKYNSFHDVKKPAAVSRDDYSKKDQGFGGVSHDRDISINKFGGMSNDKYAQNNNRFGGIKSGEHDVSSSASGHSLLHESPGRGPASKAPTVRTENFRPPVD